MPTEKIIGIKYLGTMDTMDIEVDHPQHVFYGNGIATSNSHAVAYALNTYLASYIKAHFPREFFTSSLYYAPEASHPIERISELVSDARSFNIDIRPPSLLYLNKNFKLLDSSIYFGLINIKGVGESIYKKLIRRLGLIQKQLNKSLTVLTWLDLLVWLLPYITSTAADALIGSGSLSHLKIDRKKLQFEYRKYMGLCSSQKTREQTWIENNYTSDWSSLRDCLSALLQQKVGKNGGCATRKRHELVKETLISLSQPSYNLCDSASYIADIEEELLGCPITCTTLEDGDIDDANTTCAEFNNGLRQQIYRLPIVINNKREIITKTNKKMCFLSGSDISDSVESIIVWPPEYKKFRALLYPKNNIMVVGTRGRDKDSLVTKKIYQL